MNGETLPATLGRLADQEQQQVLLNQDNATETPEREVHHAAPHSTTSGAMTDRKPDHVVIFVHGMGQALKGGTLLEWSEPLISSLRDIAQDNIERDGFDGRLVDDGQLLAPLTIEAAHSTKDVPEIYVSLYKPAVAGALPNEASRMLVKLTEAHWANDFAPGTAGATWLWGLSVAFRVWKRVLRLIRWNLYPPPEIKKKSLPAWTWWLIPVSLVAAVSFPAFVGLLMILGVLIGLSKVPGIGRWAEKIVVLFADFLGDPATWKRKPTQAAAMRQRVIDIVESVPKNTNVTIVAHSQGAAVSGQVVLSGRISPTNFVTVGSGLDLLGYARYGANRFDDPVKEWVQYAQGLRWINLWGKFDFVPAGPMAATTPKNEPWRTRLEQFKNSRNQAKERLKDRKEIFLLLYGRDRKRPRTAAGPEEHPIFNRSAVIRDHIVYSQNRIEVIDPLAQLIYDNQNRPQHHPATEDQGNIWFTKPKPSYGISDDDERKRGMRHRRMVSFLGMARVLSIGAAVFLALPLMRLVELLPAFREESTCGPAGWNWPCPSTNYRWGTFPSAGNGVFLLAVAAIAALLIWLLNNVLWTRLHALLERRRDKQDKPWCGGKTYFFWYSGCVFLLTVALPLVLPLALPPSIDLSSGIPEPYKVGYLVLAVALGIASWHAGKELPPLAARPRHGQ
jgi:hypothetical protein